MPDHVEQIKSRLDIVDVLSGYIKVQKAGVNFKARCPFHNEKTPSFSISPERQIWHCFGCSKGGDMFSFVQEVESVDFPEALKILAQKAGIELTPERVGVTNRKARLAEICDLACQFFEKQLWLSQTGKKALAYLTERGLTDETIKEFRLGFAPDQWQTLSDFLKTRGYSQSEILETGLAIANNGRQYDRFRSRITFPIFSVTGQPVGFTARVFGEGKTAGVEAAKYINTPQTQLYDKSRVLYGLHKAKTHVKVANRCLLVEGNMDALMSYQAGVQNVVATSGTALTAEQLKLLGRYSTTLDFCFDTDQAGAQATRRGIGLALSQNFTINVVSMNDKDCKDPADYVKKYGKAWVDRVKESQPVIDFYLESSRQQFDLSKAEGKNGIMAAVGPLIQQISNGLEKAHRTAQLAILFRTEDKVIADQIATMKSDLVSVAPEKPQEIIKVKLLKQLDVLNKEILGLAVMKPELVPDIDRKFLNPYLLPVLDSPELLASQDPIITDAFWQVQKNWPEADLERMKEQVKAITAKLEIQNLESQNKQLQFEIREADLNKDVTRQKELAQKIQLNSERKQQLKNTL